LIHRNSISGDLPQALREVEWIDVNDSEFERQATNVLVIKPGLVILDERHRRILEELSRRGIDGIAVRMDEITKVGGGVRCMTLPLRRSDSDY
jgi:N-dimethylarginine dimethylaminohydrolase